MTWLCSLLCLSFSLVLREGAVINVCKRSWGLPVPLLFCLLPYCVYVSSSSVFTGDVLPQAPTWKAPNLVFIASDFQGQPTQLSHQLSGTVPSASANS